MTTATELLKAPHIGIRDLRVHLSQKLKSHGPLIVTDHGAPKKVILEYQDVLELMDMVEELQDPKILRLILETQNTVGRGKIGIPVSRLFGQIRAKK